MQRIGPLRQSVDLQSHQQTVVEWPQVSSQLIRAKLRLSGQQEQDPEWTRGSHTLGNPRPGRNRLLRVVEQLL
jgi:hypothetical protein